MTASEKLFGAAMLAKIRALVVNEFGNETVDAIHHVLEKYVPCEDLSFYSYLQEDDGRTVLYAGCDWGGFRGTVRPVYDSVKGWL